MPLWGYMVFTPAAMSEDDVWMQAWKEDAEESARMEAQKQGYTLDAHVDWECTSMIYEVRADGFGGLRPSVNGETPTAHMWRLTADAVSRD